MSGTCAAGSYCILNATRAAPTDGVTGAVCPLGAFCLAGVAAPSFCQPGTFAVGTGNSAASACQSGTAGFFYNSSGLTTARFVRTTPSLCLRILFILNIVTCPCSGSCWANYYCPNSTVLPSLVCPSGARCPTASAAPTLCAPGSYQDQTTQSTCKTCPASFYCPSTGTVAPLACPPGNYCPAATYSGTQFPCLPGSYSNSSALSTSGACSSCDSGYWCSGGLTAPNALCAAGSSD